MENKFYQIQIGIDGYMPDAVYIYTDLDTARGALLDECKNDMDNGYYPTRDNDHDGNAVNYDIWRNIKRTQYSHSITLVGPLTYQDMGYASLEELIELEDLYE